MVYRVIISYRKEWRPEIWSTVGEYRGSEWFVDKHTQRTHSCANVLMKWLVDDCWAQAYSIVNSGHKINGSLDLLVQAVFACKRVRVQIDSYSMDADNLYIRNGHVFCNFCGSYPKLICMNFRLLLIGFGELHPQQGVVSWSTVLSTSLLALLHADLRLI